MCKLVVDLLLKWFRSYLQWRGPDLMQKLVCAQTKPHEIAGKLILCANIGWYGASWENDVMEKAGSHVCIVYGYTIEEECKYQMA